uniref:F-box domain-containing protein n=1 Tax=Leersia perrieri TaxID=77586 RepID=A0A0D9X4C3_9ORYZ
MPQIDKVLTETGMITSHGEQNVPDRISDLSDELLHHVMSYLTMQEAVQTCVLSQRWQNVWLSLMYIRAKGDKFSSMKIFRKFLDNVLLYRSPVPLKGFWISGICNNSDDSLDYSDIHRWVCHVLRRITPSVGILVHSGSKLLSTDGYPFPFISVHLSVLRLLHFRIDDCFVKKLSSGCPALKDLYLISCGIYVTMFSSTTLKTLVIHDAEPTEHLPKNFEHLVIDMPNLVTLHLEEIPRRNIHLVKFALSNATSLKLVSGSVYEEVVSKVLMRGLPRCKPFRNLKKLKLGERFLKDGCYPLLFLLRHSPNIEKLRLQLTKARYNASVGADKHEKFPNVAAVIDPPCKETERMFNCEKLTEIEILYPKGDKRVPIIVRILFANISPLPAIKINPCPNSGLTCSGGGGGRNAGERMQAATKGWTDSTLHGSCLIQCPETRMSAPNNETCVLSRRWKNVWSSMKWIYADAEKFGSMKSFTKFVDNFLLYRNPVPLDALWISAICNHSDDSLDFSDIHPWVRHALTSNAWALGILEHSGTNLLSVDGYNPFPFTSRHLCILRLCHFSIDDNFVKMLSSCCPVLDDLGFKSCAINVTMFSSSTLKSLIINTTETMEHFPEQFEHLVIDMPNLVTLHHDEIPNRNIQLVDVSSVKKATIYLFGLSFQNSSVDCNILSALSNATSLELISPSVYEEVVPNVLVRALPKCKIFGNPKKLTLGEWFLRDGCYPLLFLLWRSPNIEKLILQLCKDALKFFISSFHEEILSAASHQHLRVSKQ